MKKIFLLLTLTFTLYLSNAQSISPAVVASAGSTFFGSTMQIDFTVGEPAILSIENSNLLITQGFHQTYPVINSVDTPKEESLITLFPNPTADKIQIKITAKKPQSTRVQLFNGQGQLLKNQVFPAGSLDTEIDLTQLPGGQYYLHFLFDESQHTQVYNIQKIK